MRRFFIHTRDINGEDIRITGSDVHHIKDVLRLSPGAKVICIDESAAEHEVALTELAEDAVTGRIIKTTRPERPSIAVALFQGLPKGRKFDFVVEKATELGADVITPVLMERSIPTGDGAAKRTERWQRIATAAAKQSRRVTMPEIGTPVGFPALIDALGAYDRVLLFWEGASEPVDAALRDFSGKSLALVIGPEGGLAALEVEALLSTGAAPAWLGPRILRTETAPIVALAVVNHVLRR